MCKIKAWIHDCAVVLRMSLPLGICVAALLFIGAWLFYGFEVSSALSFVRSSLFVLGALMMLVSAGLLLLGEGKANLRKNEWWCRHLCVFSATPVMLLTSASILAVAVVLDYMMY